jgi:hypothetical protein
MGRGHGWLSQGNLRKNNDYIFPEYATKNSSSTKEYIDDNFYCKLFLTPFQINEETMRKKTMQVSDYMRKIFSPFEFETLRIIALT